MADNPTPWLPALAGVFGATIVAISAFLVQKWRYRADRLAAGVDLLCMEINGAADVGTTYWLLDASQQSQQTEASRLEPMLIGRQIRIQELLLALSSRAKKMNSIEVQHVTADFFGTLTGGNFKVRGRQSDAPRAQGVQSAAARLNGALRRALG